MKKFISTLSSLLLLSSTALANNSTPWPIYPNYFNSPAQARTLLGASASDGSTPYMAGNGAINPSSDNLRWSCIVNVVDDFGADPTGVGDSAPALNNAVVNGNKKINLPCGTFIVNANIGLYDNTEISGLGDCTILKPGPAITGNAQWPNVSANATVATILSNVDMAGGNSNIKIHDLKIDISVLPVNNRLVWGIGFGNAHKYSVWNVSIIGRGDSHSSGQDGIASLNSSDYHLYSNYIYGMGNAGIDQWQFSNNFKIDNNLIDSNNTGTGIYVNGLGSVSSVAAPTPTFNGVIENNTIRNVQTGLLLTGLCSGTNGACGTARDLLVTHNIIDNVTSFHGIVAGDAANDIITDNKISNVNDSCILSQSQIAGGGGITSGMVIANNHCSNINLSGGNNAAISVGNSLDIPTNFSLINNEILGAMPQASATVFGGTVVTGFTINTRGYCTAVPTVVFTGSGTSASATAVLSGGTTGNLISLTLVSGGSGYTSPPAISFTGCNPPQYTYATRVFNGAINTKFSAGYEDAGSAGTDLIAGTTVPVTEYGNRTFTNQATFSDSTLGLSIAQATNTKYAQLSFAPTNAHTYQLGVAGGSESALGVAGCNFLYDANATIVRYRLCADGDLNINPILGTAAVAKLDVNGSIRSAPVAIASLPTCNVAQAGTTQFVNNGIASPTFHQTVSTTGAALWPVHCTYDGSAYNWTY